MSRRSTRAHFEDAVASALRVRLSQVALALGPFPAEDPASAPAELQGDSDLPAAVLLALVRWLQTTPDEAALWLTMVGLSTTFPRDDELQEIRRRLRTETSADAALHLLDWSFAALADRGNPRATLRITDRVVVDVDFCARHDLHTGIQRVVRETVPIWDRQRAVDIVAWTGGFGGFRTLDHLERERVLRWAGPLGRLSVFVPEVTEIVVPWRSTVIVPELTSDSRIAEALASVAKWSGNRVAVIGYDCIPVTSGETRPPGADTFFGAYLGMVKHAGLVLGISRSATQEFAGFASMLAAQGLKGPEVRECLLPSDAPYRPVSRTTSSPVVLVVGSHEPRKNHLAVLEACELLWREGLVFELRFIGGSAWLSQAFDRRAEELSEAGRPVRIERDVTEADLWQAYADARVSVFPSFHEGFGLPVAESLALGTPAITSDYGSMREIADLGGGCLLVNPRDDSDIAAAIRTAITDDAVMAELRVQAAGRQARTWQDYADESWAMIEGLGS